MELNEKIKKNEDVLILDVRSAEKYESYNINEQNVTSLNIEKTTIFSLNDNNMDQISSLPKNKELIITCTTGNSARKCAEILSEKNYNVMLLEGGITAWKEFKSN
ncbi:rhodanese-like domain-containing protein [Cytobacillus depressus]|uniref:Rhodanese-like domain-containing protein n=2 Tax=Cytobacillus depressus TaxID=1602942 RepID=A0A6L3V0A9_9BACI|nr:rhodanese-like domain-containing protein [Cytobacillus depressus]